MTLVDEGGDVAVDVSRESSPFSLIDQSKHPF
jgi:hypothetical protein